MYVNYFLGKFQAIDGDGNPYSGGKLYTYTHGTLNAKTTYSDRSGTANTNPVILNTRGEADIFLKTDDAYKFILKDSDDATVWTKDNIEARLDLIEDADQDTGIFCESASDEDTIRCYAAGNEQFVIEDAKVYTRESAKFGAGVQSPILPLEVSCGGGNFCVSGGGEGLGDGTAFGSETATIDAYLYVKIGDTNYYIPATSTSLA